VLLQPKLRFFYPNKYNAFKCRIQSTSDDGANTTGYGVIIEFKSGGPGLIGGRKVKVLQAFKIPNPKKLG